MTQAADRLFHDCLGCHQKGLPCLDRSLQTSSSLLGRKIAFFFVSFTMHYFRRRRLAAAVDSIPSQTIKRRKKVAIVKKKARSITRVDLNKAEKLLLVGILTSFRTRPHRSEKIEIHMEKSAPVDVVSLIMTCIGRRWDILRTYQLSRWYFIFIGKITMLPNMN